MLRCSSGYRECFIKIMYYKIENKNCEVYKNLHDLRIKELAIEDENEVAIKEKTGLNFENSFGNHGQQNFRRVTQYSGLVFTEPEKVDGKIWIRHKEHSGVFVPNRKTKVGREMSDFLSNGLKASNYDRVIEILELEELRRFTLPFVEVVGEVIIIFLGDGHEPKNENVIEITKREFNDIRKQHCR